MSSLYSVLMYDRAGSLLADLTGLETSKSVTKTRNDADTLECTFSMDALRSYASALGTTLPLIVGTNLNELRISKRGTVIAAGRVVQARRGISDGSRTVTVSAVGWFGILARCYTDAALDYGAGTTDAGQVAVGLLANAQGQAYGDLGITVGTVQASAAFPVSYQADKCVKDAIVELSALSGSFDFEVTWDRKFNVYYPGIGRRRDDIPILIPGGVRELTATSDGTLFANRVIGQGSGSGAAKLRSVSDNAASQQVFGRWTTPLSRNDVLGQAQLQAGSDAYLAAVSRPITIPEVTIDGTVRPDVTQVGIGDQLRFMADPLSGGFEDLDGNYYRVESLSWTVGADGAESLKLVLAA